MRVLPDAAENARPDTLTMAAGACSRTGSARGSARVSEALARELPILVLFALLYSGVRELTQGGTVAAGRHAAQVLDLEQRLGIAWEHGMQSVVLGHRALVTFVNWTYIWGHWPVIAAVGILLFSFRRDRYRLLRNAVIASGIISFLLFGFFPCAPPRLADGGLVDTVTRWSESYRTLQPPRFTNQYAAMPSLHFGWNLLVGVVLFGSTRSRVARGFAVVMPAAMAFAVVATANHWVLDVVAGTIVVMIGLLVARLIERRATKADGTLLYWTRVEHGNEMDRRPALRRRTSGRERPRPASSRAAGRPGGRGRRSALPRVR